MHWVDSEMYAAVGGACHRHVLDLVDSVEESFHRVYVYAVERTRRRIVPRPEFVGYLAGGDESVSDSVGYLYVYTLAYGMRRLCSRPYKGENQICGYSQCRQCQPEGTFHLLTASTIAGS